MPHKNIFGEDVPDGLCKAPLDWEAWENCEYAIYNRETGFIECHGVEGPEGCFQTFEEGE